MKRYELSSQKYFLGTDIRGTTGKKTTEGLEESILSYADGPGAKSYRPDLKVVGDLSGLWGHIGGAPNHQRKKRQTEGAPSGGSCSSRYWSVTQFLMSTFSW